MCTFYLIGSSHQITKKFGAVAFQEDIFRNKEYFDNLQKCYNPSDVDLKSDFERSQSSDGVLSQLMTSEQKIASLLGVAAAEAARSTEDLSAPASSPPAAPAPAKVLRRAHTHCVLRPCRPLTPPHASNLVENEEIAAEKSEDPGDKTEEGEPARSSVESSIPECENEDETRQRSIQKLRGILKESMAAGAVVRNIKFLVEAGASAPRAQARLRSPPPAHCSPPLSAEEEEAEAGQIFLTSNIFSVCQTSSFTLQIIPTEGA